MNRQRLVVMGAAGRDFRDFNVVYRDDPAVEVVAFTATQIPGIANRHYPPVSGPSLSEILESIRRMTRTPVLIGG